MASAMASRSAERICPVPANRAAVFSAAAYRARTVAMAWTTLSGVTRLAMPSKALLRTGSTGNPLCCADSRTAWAFWIAVAGNPPDCMARVTFRTCSGAMPASINCRVMASASAARTITGPATASAPPSSRVVNRIFIMFVDRFIDALLKAPSDRKTLSRSKGYISGAKIQFAAPKSSFSLYLHSGRNTSLSIR